MDEIVKVAVSGARGMRNLACITDAYLDEREAREIEDEARHKSAEREARVRELGQINACHAGYQETDVQTKMC